MNQKSRLQYKSNVYINSVKNKKLSKTFSMPKPKSQFYLYAFYFVVKICGSTMVILGNLSQTICRSLTKAGHLNKSETFVSLALSLRGLGSGRSAHNRGNNR